MKNKNLVAIVGPTAIGKTSLSIALARAFHTEIISADSRQFYKEMNIGTAAPTAEELQAAPHHFIHNISIQDEYSVGDYERDALQKIEDLFQKSPILILVGGSGLYVKSLLEGLDNFPEVDPLIRKQLNQQLNEQGLSPLKEKLNQLDPFYFSRVDIENPHRVIRALEICLGTGKPYSSFLEGAKQTRDFNAIKIGLTAPREIIYDRINMRVDLMMEQGLLEEAEHLYPLKELNALNTVGYKELFKYIEGDYSLEEAIAEIKKNTRRFAKRQLTWFRKEKDITWFEYSTKWKKLKIT
ncbi:tRNA (adenosine(37)-N6)-dimethylallyltransferase MiaA [Antarcticibacterium sp. 1MA-6-2]|uniref:tRNA (adenosine(37)-N6)-dimethylallyltransferase MiaA n=1 Tax=Antarcticibacterium sp. 1MA-6-2 TaxID=2908210 RepID=UPI001F01F15F|nr:tRNA (adenosine(37)-N6)-dimethylallyltransferase MiaA [Antarcticibacterium sp. 1MA-6-2]UJH91198.1 tRNA (adenosine(37)-N6)-dimethylallyltransferase MiaA [Antarcticibacterium sp. 1MA-6-2]